MKPSKLLEEIVKGAKTPEELAELNRRLFFLTNLIDDINRADNLNEIVSNTLKEIAGYYGAFCSISLDYNEKSYAFGFEESEGRISNEAKQAADEAKKELYLLSLVASGKPATICGPIPSDSRIYNFIIPIQKENEGKKNVHGILQIARENQGYSDIEIEIIYRAARALGTAIGGCYSELEAATDYLTRIKSRRKFMDRLLMWKNECDRYNEPMHLIMTDIDNFKEINDVYGHNAGDVALKGFAEILIDAKRNVKLHDICRWAGDEFMAVVLGGSDKQAYETAEDIRKQVEMNGFGYFKGDITKGTISAGVCRYEPHVDGVAPLKEFIDKTDQALYHAKEQKNKVFFG